MCIMLYNQHVYNLPGRDLCRWTVWLGYALKKNDFINEFIILFGELLFTHMNGGICEKSERNTAVLKFGTYVTPSAK